MKKILNFSWLKEWKKIYQEDGFKILIKKKGWTVAFALFIFFLTKGLLWLLIPYLLAKGIF